MADLDHLLWATPDLDAGTAAVATLTGVAPARGGSHPGFGTRNSLLSLGSAYLEVIAPDPAQPPGPWSEPIAALPRPGLTTFAVRSRNLRELAAAAVAAGLAAADPVAMSRTRPDGTRLAWTILTLSHPAYGRAVPFAIDWQDSPHPAGTTPGGCVLRDFAVLHPDPGPLRAIYAALGLAVPVRGAMAPGFAALLDTPRGEVVLVGP